MQPAQLPGQSTFLLPGSGLETTLSHHHNGVMTYSRYVNGSILSVPKFNHSSQTAQAKAQQRANGGGDIIVYGLVKSFLG